MTEKESHSIEVQLNDLAKNSNNNDLVNLIENRFDSEGISIFTGYSKFNYEKLRQMIFYFSSNINYLSKTKLNKLLFYADFSNFNRLTVSMSGVIYQHDHYGPVPKNSDLIYSSLQENGSIDFVPFQGFTGEQVISEQSFDASWFSPQELQVLADVVKTFIMDNANMISEKSHEEVAYLETKIKQEIPYSYSADLKYRA